MKNRLFMKIRQQENSSKWKLVQNVTCSYENLSNKKLVYIDTLAIENSSMNGNLSK